VQRRGFADQLWLGIAAQEAERVIDPDDATSPFGDQYRICRSIQCSYRNCWLFSIIVPSDAAVGAGYVVSDQGKERGGLIKIDFKRAT
jgi:hypothetical protein